MKICSAIDGTSAGLTHGGATEPGTTTVIALHAALQVDSTVWEIAARDDSGHGHGTQKPVECMERPIRNHLGDVHDPFLGSGTTLIAAERQSRGCFGMELSPTYAQVAIDRWEQYTGQKAVRIGEAEGKH